MTAQEEIDLIDNAIEALLTGQAQSYSINGRAVTKLDYRFLVERKKELAPLAAREAGTATCPVAKFRRHD